MTHRFTVHQKTPFILHKLHHRLPLVFGSFGKLGCRILRSRPGLIPGKEMMVQVPELSKIYKIGLYKELLGLYSPFFSHPPCPAKGPQESKNQKLKTVFTFSLILTYLNPIYSPTVDTNPDLP